MVLARRVGPFSVREQTRLQVWPTGEGPLQTVDFQEVDADAAHPDGDSIRPVAPSATCAETRGAATVDVPEARAREHGWAGLGDKEGSDVWPLRDFHAAWAHGRGDDGSSTGEDDHHPAPAGGAGSRCRRAGTRSVLLVALARAALDPRPRG